MLTLAIETSGMSGGIALSHGPSPVAEFFLSSRETHSRRLMPSIMWLLERASVSMPDLKCVAVSLGPGSFTGLRIGLSTARGLALALGIPLAGVPTFDALAANIPAVPGMLLCPVADARKYQVYTACYRAGGTASEWDRIMPFQACAPEHLPQLLADAGVLTSEGTMPLSSLLLTGDGLGRYGTEIKDAFALQPVTFVPEHLWIPRPMSVAAIAGRYLDSSSVSNSR